MPSTTEGPLPLTLRPLATFAPPSSTRTWFSAPHPSVPLLATASSDKTVRVYSLATFALHSTVSGGHKRSVRACAWKPASSGETVIATGSFDASAGVWRRWEDGAAARKVREAEVDLTASGGDEDEDDWRFAVLLDGHESEIKSVAWSASGNLLATCSRDKTVWVWEELEDDNFETVAVLQDHDADVKCVAWHPQEDLLASASYDETIRLYREEIDDWTCVAVLAGHAATVWSIDFEGVEPRVHGKVVKAENEAEGSREKTWAEEWERAGPRLVSSSDDLTVRVWKRRPKEGGSVQPRGASVPSIIKSTNIEEEWMEEAQLPQRHDRAIYAAAWSESTGRVVSAGSDGKIVVYEERWRATGEPTNGPNGDKVEDAFSRCSQASATVWVVVAEVECAHDVYEINHVCWSRRWDKKRRREDEEMVISTGDDGEVKAWVLDGST